MEYIDIFDENNNPIGEIKEKTKAHEDGNFHRTAHVWIIRLFSSRQGDVSHFP